MNVTARRAGATESGLRGLEVSFGRGWFTSETAIAKRPPNRNDANGYYDALGLSPDATSEEIKRAYRKLVKKLHPDRDGDEELFRFITEIYDVLINPESKNYYDSVEGDAVYLGKMEREELARIGLLKPLVEKALEEREVLNGLHWACLISSESSLDSYSDKWIELCGEVSPAVGYRGRIRVGVLEGGEHWPCDQPPPWGILSTGPHSFVIFQRGVEPSRLIALCAMIEWQRFLLIHRTERREETWP